MRFSPRPFWRAMTANGIARKHQRTCKTWPSAPRKGTFYAAKGHLSQGKTWPFCNTLTARKIGAERETAPHNLPEGRGMVKRQPHPTSPRGREW